MGYVPFVFCHYSALVDEQELDPTGLRQALTDIQGQYLPHGKKAEKEGKLDTVVMRPRSLEVNGETVVTWAIGHRPGHRTWQGYDAGEQQIIQRVQQDDHITLCHIVALPRLQAMAINDRQNALNMGARSALSRTRSAFRHIAGGHFAFSFLQPGDVTAIMENLALKEYSYTVRRINPTPPGVLAAALDTSMDEEGIFVLRGVAKPAPSGAMHPEEGILAQTAQMADGGYAVVGFKGETEDGRIAQIRKPPFSLEKAENLKQMEKEQPLRVFVDEESEEEILASVVAELVRFYGPNEAPGVPEEPA